MAVQFSRSRHALLRVELQDRYFDHRGTSEAQDILGALGRATAILGDGGSNLSGLGSLSLALLLFLFLPSAAKSQGPQGLTGSWQVNADCGGATTATIYWDIDEDVGTGALVVNQGAECGTLNLGDQTTRLNCDPNNLPAPMPGQVTGTDFAIPAVDFLPGEAIFDPPILIPASGCGDTPIARITAESRWAGTIVDNGSGTAVRGTGENTGSTTGNFDPNGNECGSPGVGYVCLFYMLRRDTSVGSNQTVEPLDGATVTFTEVTAGGTTSVTPLTEPDGVLPANFQLLGTPIFFDVTTSAEFTGSITVCLPYPDEDDDGLVDCLVTSGALNNGGFECGTLAGWTSSSINGGASTVVEEGTCCGGSDTTGLVFDGKHAARLRSVGLDSVGILTSDPFIAGSTILFEALSQERLEPVTVEVRILDGSGQTVISSQVIQMNLVDLVAPCPSEPRNGPFSSHEVDTSALAGESVRVQFRQHTNVEGVGFISLVDSVTVLDGPAGSGISEDDLRIFHEEGGVFVDRTVSVDTVNNQVCADVTSLSQFVLTVPLVPEPQNKDQQKCINNLNKGAGKVMKAQGGEVLSCIKSASRERLLGTLQECLTDDLKGKVQKALDKLHRKVGNLTSCEKADPPALGFSSAATGGRASIDKELRLVHSIFGSDLDSGVIVTDKPGSKCQQGVWKAVQKCQDTKIKEFNKCKKDGLKGKTPPGPINSGTDLERLCLQSDPNDPTTPQPDPKGKINGKCIGGIQKAIDRRCVGLDTAPLFPGCGGPVSQACLDSFVECEVCRALNEIDVLSRDCDEFDDGIANGSCPDISLCGPCTSDSQCPTVFVCNVGDICLQSCQCPLCAVCAGNCVL